MVVVFRMDIENICRLTKKKKIIKTSMLITILPEKFQSTYNNIVLCESEVSADLRLLQTYSTK